jgi:GNAT superfamily N-acetyltransferase
MDHLGIAIQITDAADAAVRDAIVAPGWLFVELLFVPESLRGKGIGAELLARAENEAIARGCHSAS